MNEPHIWWYVTRASAVIAWVLMTFAVVWGILLSTRIMRNIDNPAWLQDLHKYLGGTSLVMVGLHMVSLMLDGWLQFSIVETLVPFATDFKPLPVALGILAFYVLAAVQFTSLLMQKLPRKLWKAIHYSSYATLILVSFHAAFSGTDVGSSWYRVVSIALIVIASLAVVLRIIASNRSNAAVPVAGTAATTAATVAASRLSPAPVASAVAPSEPLRELTSYYTPPPTTGPIPMPGTRTMVVANTGRMANEVLGIRLVPLGAGHLPMWYPGAHITLHLPNGMERQYSLCSDPADRTHFDIAVLRTQASEGGSIWIHEHLAPGLAVKVTGPLNHFVLEPAAEYLFIAGGIGITPIKAMIESLPARRDWRLIYVGRSRSTMAFVTELEQRYPGRVLIHASDENTVDVDLRAIVGGTTAEVYCCGPESLMSAVADLVPTERMHYERFIAIARTPELPPAPLAVTCSRSNKSFTLAPDENLLTELENNGVPVMGSCRKGLCGTCEVRVLDGTPQHLDSVMDDSEKDRLNVMYPCVSRASGPSLVLDV